MNIKLLGDRVIVEHKGMEEEIQTGFTLLPSTQEAARRGKVVNVGPGIDNKKMTVKVGDDILYGKDSGIEIMIDSKKVLIMREPDIYLVIKDEKSN